MNYIGETRRVQQPHLSGRAHRWQETFTGFRKTDHSDAVALGSVPPCFANRNCFSKPGFDFQALLPACMRTFNYLPANLGRSPFKPDPKSGEIQCI